ncbi:xylanase [Anopheles sinensis]|uniref:Xylanase n=1 Tax=Anopheles sinensis TaxID=74873 RepID=A0A084WC16_ANOSI|nr:xylanase [Anopheles sinensis]
MKESTPEIRRFWKSIRWPSTSPVLHPGSAGKRGEWVVLLQGDFRVAHLALDFGKPLNAHIKPLRTGGSMEERG